ncbi:MAG: glycosyltransferase family 4 protein [Deferribacterales bacterium]
MSRRLSAAFNTYPMAFNTPGGGEIQLLAYKKHLGGLNVEVDLFNLWEPEFNKYDLMHFFSCIGGSYHFCSFVRQLGIPLVITSSLWITRSNKHNYALEEIRAQLNLADRIVTNSDMESDTLADVLDLPRERFSKVYNGVEDIFYDGRISGDVFRSHFGVGYRFVLNVGNIEPRKNQLTLAKAVKQVPQLKLIMIGHVRDKEYMEQVLKEGGDSAVYLGALPNDSRLLRSAYAACDVFCLPSTLETPGLAALEAYASGAKIVLTSEGSTKEYFCDDVEYVVHDDVNSVRDAIIKTAEQPLAADKRLIDFRWSNALKDLRKIYNEVVRGS